MGWCRQQSEPNASADSINFNLLGPCCSTLLVCDKTATKTADIYLSPLTVQRPASQRHPFFPRTTVTRSGPVKWGHSLTHGEHQPQAPLPESWPSRCGPVGQEGAAWERKIAQPHWAFAPLRNGTVGDTVSPPLSCHSFPITSHSSSTFRSSLCEHQRLPQCAFLTSQAVDMGLLLGTEGVLQRRSECGFDTGSLVLNVHRGFKLIGSVLDFVRPPSRSYMRRAAEMGSWQ
ncbi:hypothetical protein B0T14DRAFT_66166 [Immersiella caudata]|uniref:Uncharacterized protein n=1 Tax=Immersiella caudata TaxID=314043 RepID=A0AA39XHV0_9PEZI|nr:hypothetical protein B0T14DRAFT_66166 [Immersiella caudata]